MPRTGGTGGGGIQLHELSFGLFLQAKINPTVWDSIPQVPRYSRGMLDVIAAQIIKTIAFSLHEESIQKELHEQAVNLYESGKTNMSYEEDWFCGNIFLPVHLHHGVVDFFNFSNVDFNPQPNPPERYYGAILTIIAYSINHETIACALKNITVKPKAEYRIVSEIVVGLLIGGKHFYLKNQLDSKSRVYDDCKNLRRAIQ